jgi:hypothetical protein
MNGVFSTGGGGGAGGEDPKVSKPANPRSNAEDVACA